MAKILHRGDCRDGYIRGEGYGTLSHTDEELQQQLITIEECGRICYRSGNIDLLTSQTADKFIRSLIKRGHHSVIEHSSLTVIFENISRGFTHEMVRHRLASFSQESTRYCDYAGGKLDLEKAELIFIHPPHQPTPSSMNDISIIDQLQIQGADEIEYIYQMLRQNGWKPQDARQFLPIGIAAKIAVTANFREWRHIMRMRTQKTAHWEIRYVMCDLLAKLKEIIPVIFEDFKFSESPDANGYRYTL